MPSVSVVCLLVISAIGGFAVQENNRHARLAGITMFRMRYPFDRGIRRELMKSGRIFFLLSVSLAFAAFALSIFANVGAVGRYDFFIFEKQAQYFIETGFLYDRDLGAYWPAAPVYKFPPLYGALLVIGKQMGASYLLVSYLCWWLQILCWLYSFLLICQFVGVKEDRSKLVLFGVVCIYWFLNDYFLQNAYRLQLEPYVLLLMSLAFRDFIRERNIRSGFWIGFAAALKVYPIFMLPLFIVLRRWCGLLGLMVGVAVTLLLTVPVLGWQEHSFYLLHVFPLLMREGVSGLYENVSIARMLVPYTMIRPELGQNFPVLVTHGVAIISLLIFLIRINITQKKIHAYKGSGIDFAVLASISLVYMQNFWWNYQILNLLPGAVAVALCLSHGRRYIFPSVLLLSMLIIQVFITAPELWFLDFSEVVFRVLQDPNFIYMRGSIQILLVISLLLCQWIFHRTVCKS